MDRKTGNRITFGIIISVFLCYNIVLYTQNTSASSSQTLSTQALLGETLWQNNNCIACHQLYGLGGYLGPDLTNIASNPNKGQAYAKAMLNSGIKAMPKFNFTDKQKDDLIAFLIEVDKTGFYPCKEVEFDHYGWVKIKYK